MRKKDDSAGQDNEEVRADLDQNAPSVTEDQMTTSRSSTNKASKRKSTNGDTHNPNNTLHALNDQNISNDHPKTAAESDVTVHHKKAKKSKDRVAAAADATCADGDIQPQQQAGEVACGPETAVVAKDVALPQPVTSGAEKKDVDKPVCNGSTAGTVTTKRGKRGAPSASARQGGTTNTLAAGSGNNNNSNKCLY